MKTQDEIDGKPLKAIASMSSSEYRIFREYIIRVRTYIESLDRSLNSTTHSTTKVKITPALFNGILGIGKELKRIQNPMEKAMKEVPSNLRKQK